ncbi:MAG TPA: hypothetical protein VE035_13140 [Puia sp.]|nr:hypothetical protein [Puia sp.]
MKSKQTFFFAEWEDISPIIKEAESKMEVHYYLTGSFEDPEIPHYMSFSETPDPGRVKYGDWNHHDDYLVMPRDTLVAIREVPQRKGGIRYLVDQLANSKGIALKIGGIFQEGILVGGRLATGSENEFSLGFYKLLSTMIKKQFTRIGTFYVGKNAETRLREGWRLVTDDKSPKEYDLAFS